MSTVPSVAISWIEILSVAPLLVVFFGALLVLLLEVLTKPIWPRAGLTSLILVTALVYGLRMAELMEPGRRIFNNLLYADPFQAFFGFLLIFGTLLAVILGANRIREQGIEAPGEYYSLILMALAGGLVLVAAAEFITFFIGLEILSMALYALCAAALGQKRSAEAGVKYFLLGSFSSAFLLYGIALLYGLTGSFEFEQIGNALANTSDPIAYAGIGLVLFGLIFKIGLVPFHFWAPDVYQGAPTGITAFMAVVVKTAAIGAGLRIVWTALGSSIDSWSGMMWLVAVLTMLLGNLAALRQRSLKRMLAYSSIAHAGYISIGFLLPGIANTSGPAIVYYLVAYMFMTIGAFGVLLACQSKADGSDDITEFNGFAQNNPLLAALLAVFMLAMAGLPPAMSGFLAKFYIISAALKANYVGLAIIAVISAAIGCYYYLRVIVAMYFINNDDAVAAVRAPQALLAIVMGCALLVVALGIFPSLIYDVAGFVVAGIANRH